MFGHTFRVIRAHSALFIHSRMSNFSLLTIRDFIRFGSERTLRELRELGIAHTLSFFVGQKNVLGLAAACQVSAISGKEEDPQSDISEGQKKAADHLVEAVEVFLKEGRRCLQPAVPSCRLTVTTSYFVHQ
jgi:hypothetical protein